MIGYIILVFLTGGMFGIMGMAMLVCVSKMKWRQPICMVKSSESVVC